jgi:hypothetical protein
MGQLMRDSAALEAYMQAILEAYPAYMAGWLECKGLTATQWRMAPAVLICREEFGDLAAIAQLDQLEAGAATWRSVMGVTA